MHEKLYSGARSNFGQILPLLIFFVYTSKESSGPEVIKLFMLKSTEHEISTTHQMLYLSYHANKC